MTSTLGVKNPLRYRGYIYDGESSLYYLKSRYYNPSIGRFINADTELVGVGVALCVAAVTVLTCGVGTATLAGAVAVGAAKGTLIGAAAGAAIGAGIRYKKTKTLKGAAIGFGIGASVGATVGGGISGEKFGTFSSKASLTQHFDKHGKEFKGIYDNVKEYAEGAKYVIKNGTYIPEKNAYVRFLGSNGKANYAFVGMKSGGRVSTFHVRSVSAMAKDGITLFVK